MDLKDRVLEEMLADHGDALERNFELAKKLIRITPAGKVEILADRNKLTGKELILLYLIGKRYANVAGLADSEGVSNQELMDELGMPLGSVLPWTKDLRDNNKIKAIKQGIHTIPLNNIEKILHEIGDKLRTQQT